MDYGLGAIFGCPAHDQRDLDFANKYNLDVIMVVQPKNSNKKITNEAVTGDGTIVNSDFLNGLSVENAKEKIIDYFKTNGLGSQKTNYKLRDWGYQDKDIGVVLFQFCIEKMERLFLLKKRVFLYCFLKTIPQTVF